MYRIRIAEDALTRYEKRVYHLLWKSGKRSPDSQYSCISKGYDQIARESGITKRNIVNILQRLIGKGFLELTAPPITVGGRKPATYKVPSPVVILEQYRHSGKNWMIRIGSGVFSVEDDKKPVN